MKTYPRWLLLLLLASAALTACTAPVTPVAAPSAAPSEPTSQQAPPPTEAAVSPTPDQPLAALVNGQPIYLVDYERQVAQYQAAVLDPAGIDLSSPEGQEQLLQARERVLDVMIEQVLVEQAAVGMGIVVTDEEVDAALAQLITDVGGEEPFQARLDQDGMTRQDAWNELRAGLIGSKVMDQVTASLPTTAEQGIPLPNPLPRVTRSGLMSQCSMQNILPVRPNDDCTSSRMNIRPFSLRHFSRPSIHPGGGMMPPAPP